MTKDITITNGHEEVLTHLLEMDCVVFTDSGFLYYIGDSANGGWTYDVYNIEDCPKDIDGYSFLDDDGTLEPFDGGLCCGTEQDAIETATQSEYSWKERYKKLECNCCTDCDCENEEIDDDNFNLSHEIIEIAKINALGSIVCNDDITGKMYDKFINPEDFSLEFNIWEPYCEYPDDWLANQCEAEYNNYINFARAIQGVQK